MFITYDIIRNNYLIIDLETIELEKKSKKLIENIIYNHSLERNMESLEINKKLAGFGFITNNDLDNYIKIHYVGKSNNKRYISILKIIDKLEVEYNLIYNENKLKINKLLILWNYNKIINTKIRTEYFKIKNDLKYIPFIREEYDIITINPNKDYKIKFKNKNEIILPRLNIEGDIDNFLLDFILSAGNRYVRRDVKYFLDLLFLCAGETYLLAKKEIIPTELHEKYVLLIPPEATNIIMTMGLPKSYFEIIRNIVQSNINWNEPSYITKFTYYNEQLKKYNEIVKAINITSKIFKP